MTIEQAVATLGIPETMRIAAKTLGTKAWVDFQQSRKPLDESLSRLVEFSVIRAAHQAAMSAQTINVGLLAVAAEQAAQAAAAAFIAKHGGDGGTCNFDRAMVPNSKAMLAALTAAGLRTSIRDWGLYKGQIAISSPIPAQGGVNTVQAIAIAEVFADGGIEAHVYYRMD